MTHEILQVVWFFLIGVLFVGYAVLDGFDLGVGIWHLFFKKDGERRALLNSIGPFWDGNEVWLLTAGGAMFAAFPGAYATVFSGFYLALMLVLFALIFRAVALEFRSKIDSPVWRARWDVAFAVGSILPALLYGVALGNILRGIPLSVGGDYTGTFFGLLNPYSLLIGLTGLAMFALHGALWIAVRIEGEPAERALGWAKSAWYAYASLFVLGSIWTLAAQPHLLANFRAAPVLWIIPLLAALAIVATGQYTRSKKALPAFIASSLSIAGLWGIVGASIFPNMVPATGDAALSLTIRNASSSHLTLTVMFIIALIGVPIVLGYTIWAYKTFTSGGRLAADEKAGGY